MSSSYPAGTVTFLFTDIEGSTKLLQELGAEYGVVVSDHRRILREAFGSAGGREVDTQGDAFFFAFPTAPGAVVDATEESVANALFVADTVTGVDGHTAPGLPIDRVLSLIRG